MAELDEAANDYPQQAVVSCQAHVIQHGWMLICTLPLLHAGDHQNGPERWPR